MLMVFGHAELGGTGISAFATMVRTHVDKGSRADNFNTILLRLVATKPLLVWSLVLNLLLPLHKTCLASSFTIQMRGSRRRRSLHMVLIHRSSRGLWHTLLSVPWSLAQARVDTRFLATIQYSFNDLGIISTM